MRRPVGIAAIALALVVALVGLVTARELRQFRSRPTHGVVERYFSSALPHHVLGRAVLLLPGGHVFNGDVSQWVLWAEPGDNFWNRWLVERLLVALPSDLRRERLAEYPLSPTRSLVPLCLEALDSKDLPPPGERWVEDEQRAAVLDLLQRIPDTTAEVDAWVQSEVVAAGDLELLARVLPTLVRHDLVDWPALLARHWTGLERWSTAAAVGADLRQPTPRAQAFLAFLEAERAAGRIEPDELLAFLGPYLAMDATRDPAGRMLAAIAREHPPLEGEEVGDPWVIDPFFAPAPEEAAPRIARTLFDTARPVHPELAASAFHHLVHADIEAAEQLAAAFHDEGDSTLRKAAIVLLIRHGSHTAGRWMDEAFAGTAPRRTYFSGAFEYVYGSRATELYEEISGHDYLGGGKAWPPASDPPADAAERWAAFIDRYPWHPGTDDATYQLLHARFRAGEHRRVLAGAEAYFARERPDRDADPWVAHLVRESLLSSPAEPDDPPWVRSQRTLAATSLAELLAGPRHALRAWIAALEWLREDEERLRAAGIEPHTARVMARTADAAFTTPGWSVAELGRTDDLDPGTVYEAFYGLHLYPEAHADAVLSTRQVEVARRGARAMAGLIERELARASARGDADDAQAIHRWTLAHGTAQGPALALAGELQGPFRWFAEVDPERVPWPLRSRVRAIQSLLVPGDVASP